LIAGAPDDSAYSAELTRRAAESSADVIVLARYLTREEFDSCFIAADVIAMPYLAIDQSGVMLYAMTAGKAIVASRLPAFVETLGDTGGELVEPGSVEDIAHALCQLVADPNLRKRYGSAARQIASKRHEWSAVAARTIAVYKSCALS
jgi:glycosyltransferase involved in cell wall biosynthesis